MTLGASINLASFQQIMTAKKIAAYKEMPVRRPKQLQAK